MPEPTGDAVQDMKNDIVDLLGDDGAEPADNADNADQSADVPEEPIGDEPPVDDAPVEDATDHDVPAELPDDPAELKNLLTQTLAQMAELKQLVTAQKPTEPIVPVAPAPPVADPTDAVKTLIDAVQNGQPYLTKEELDGVVDNPELINTAIRRSQEQFITQLISALPAITGTLVEQHTTTRNIVDKFYAENKDLADHKSYLKVISAELMEKNKNMSVSDMLKATATEARKRLKLPVPKVAAAPAAAPVTRGQAPKPAFVKQRQGAVAQVAKRPSSEGTSEKAQIAEMLKK